MNYNFYEVRKSKSTFLSKYYVEYSILKTFYNYVDSDGEHVITRDNFCEDVTQNVLERWLGPREDWAEEFDSIDMTNKKGDGNFLFRVSLRYLWTVKNKTKLMICHLILN